MFEDDYINSFIRLSILAVIFIGAGYGVFVLLQGVELLPAASSVVPIVAGIMVCVGLVCAVGAGIMGLNWLMLIMAHREADFRRARAITPTTQAIIEAAKLTDLQAAALPRVHFGTQIGIAVSAGSRVEYLITPDGYVPMQWVKDFLKECGPVKLKAVRSYNDKTPERAFARLVTDWLCSQGYSTPYDGGPIPATWRTATSKVDALTQLFPGEGKIYTNLNAEEVL